MTEEKVFDRFSWIYIKPAFRFGKSAVFGVQEARKAFLFQMRWYVETEDQLRENVHLP